MPYGGLIPRVQRFAVREFSQDPALPFPEFEQRLAGHIFGRREAGAQVRDLLELQRIWNFESDWYCPSPLLDPVFFQTLASSLRWTPEKLAQYDRNLQQLREIAERNQSSENAAAKEMGGLAGEVANRWGKTSPSSSR